MSTCSIRGIIFLLLLQIPSLLFSQKKDTLRWGIEPSLTYSYTGVGGGLGIVLRKRQNEYTLKARTSLGYVTRASGAPLGGGLGLRHLLFEKPRWAGFFDVSYEDLFMRIHSPYISSPYWYQVHELYFGYGTRLGKGHFKFSNCIGYGGYAEMRHDPIENENYFLFHFGPFIKLFGTYEF